MIASISGSVQSIGKNSLVINVGGVGLRVIVPKGVLEDTGGVGRNIFLNTYLAVRETALTLYGFETEDDLRLFELLIGINKIGPKVALAVLSTLSPEILRSAVMQEEAVVLQRVPGIGKKSAETILFALRGKLDAPDASSVGLVSDVDADVIDFLTALGFSIVEAQTAIQKLPRNVRSVDERVALALKQLDQA
ncbi:MAG: Holliday junction branch migration protein RuvA [Candidatus Promineifilaceae bacterium]